MVVISELDEMRSVHSFPKLVGNWGKGVYKVLYKQVMLVVVVCQTTVCTDRQWLSLSIITKTTGFLL